MKTTLTSKNHYLCKGIVFNGKCDVCNMERDFKTGKISREPDPIEVDDTTA